MVFSAGDSDAPIETTRQPAALAGYIMASSRSTSKRQRGLDIPPTLLALAEVIE
jgi:hypothetical protein